MRIRTILPAYALLVASLPAVAACRSTTPTGRQVRPLMHMAARPLREIVAEISKQSGAAVAVEPTVSEWKATVAYRGTLDGILDALCAEFKLARSAADARAGRAGFPRNAVAAHR